MPRFSTVASGLVLVALGACAMPASDRGARLPAAFQGLWAADPAHCINADLVGQTALAPIRISRDAVVGVGSTCTVDSVLGPDTVGRYALRQSCLEEGLPVSRTTQLELQAGDSMVFTTLGQPGRRLFSCG